MVKKKAAKTGDGVVVIVKPTIAVINVRIVGKTRLVVHNYARKSGRQVGLPDWGIVETDDPVLRYASVGKVVKEKRGPRDPVKAFNESRYRLDAIDAERAGVKVGCDGFPARGIRLAIIEACGFVDGATKTHVSGCVFVNPGQDLIPINGSAIMKFDIVSVGNKAGPHTGAPDARFRAEYWPWSMDLQIHFDASLFNEQQIIGLLDRAGMSIGLGENRPQKRGDWGMFEVAEVAEMGVTETPEAEAAE